MGIVLRSVGILSDNPGLLSHNDKQRESVVYAVCSHTVFAVLFVIALIHQAKTEEKISGFSV